MKKYLYIMAAMAGAMAVSSCSNDEIVITTVARNHTLTYNVGTKTMYDQMEITSDIEDGFLRNKSMCIGVTTFLYDQDGKLVDQKLSTLYAFNTITESFVLPEGSYTLVSVETLLDPTDNSMSQWAFEGIDNLSTLQIVEPQGAGYEYFYDAFGVATTNVNLTEELTVTASPDAVGQRVSVSFYNFDESDFVNLAFGTIDAVTGYKLDPTLSASERLIKDMVGEDELIIRGLTSNKGTDHQYFSVYVLDDKITWCVAVQGSSNANTANWSVWGGDTTWDLTSSKVWYFGTYYNANGSLDTAWETSSVALTQWYEGILENATLVPDVVLDLPWGSTVSFVQALLSSYTMTKGDNGKAILVDDGSYELRYEGKGRIDEICYSFLTETTGLFETDVLYPNDKVSLDELKAYCDANYLLLVEYEGIYMYCDMNFSTYIMLFALGNQWNLGFVDVSYVAGSSAQAPSVPEVMKAKAQIKSGIANKCTLSTQNSRLNQLVKDAVEAFGE